MIKIALVDVPVILRKSLGILIGILQDFDITLQADNGQDFIDQLKSKPSPRYCFAGYYRACDGWGRNSKVAETKSS